MDSNPGKSCQMLLASKLFTSIQSEPRDFVSCLAGILLPDVTRALLGCLGMPPELYRDAWGCIPVTRTVSGCLGMLPELYRDAWSCRPSSIGMLGDVTRALLGCLGMPPELYWDAWSCHPSSIGMLGDVTRALLGCLGMLPSCIGILGVFSCEYFFKSRKILLELATFACLTLLDILFNLRQSDAFHIKECLLM